jgi:hypothetical protein
MVMHDDNLPDIGDIWMCQHCGTQIHLLPPGASPAIPFHIINRTWIVDGKEETGLANCGVFVFLTKCSSCIRGTCIHQKVYQEEKRNEDKTRDV